MSKVKHLVIVVHGFNDYARWQDKIRKDLEANGFTVALTNYGRMGFFAFLSSIPYFRRRVIDEVWRQIQDAKKIHSDAQQVSIIAHSFGTYIVGQILQEQRLLQVNKLVFCGSVLPHTFHFAQITDQFDTPVLNDVGTADQWPAIGEKLTSFCGSAGTYGFKRPGVRDRYHNGAKHNYFFLNDFCNKFWIPFLRNGVIVESNKDAADPPGWIKFISQFPLKLTILGIALAAAVGLHHLYSNWYVTDLGPYVLHRTSDEIYTKSPNERITKKRIDHLYAHHDRVYGTAYVSRKIADGKRKKVTWKVDGYRQGDVIILTLLKEEALGAERGVYILYKEPEHEMYRGLMAGRFRRLPKRLGEKAIRHRSQCNALLYVDKTFKNKKVPGNVIGGYIKEHLLNKDCEPI